jgi:hypothetical protein
MALSPSIYLQALVLHNAEIVRILQVEFYRSVLVYELRLAQRARYALNYLAVLPELCPEILVLPTLADIFSASKVPEKVLSRSRISDPKPIFLRA